MARVLCVCKGSVRIVAPVRTYPHLFYSRLDMQSQVDIRM